MDFKAHLEKILADPKAAYLDSLAQMPYPLDMPKPYDGPPRRWVVTKPCKAARDQDTFGMWSGDLKDTLDEEGHWEYL